MQIQWLGLASFKIQTKNSVIITDPYSDSSGLIMPKSKADIILVSDTQNALANNVKRLSGDSFLITGPGEYEVKHSFVYGIPAKNTIYLIEDEDIKIAFLGLLDSDLKDKHLESIEGADILLLPVGTLTKEQRTILISQVEPKVIIPYLYKQPKVKQSLEPLETFLKEMGIKDTEPIDKYSIKKQNLPQEETIVTILKHA
ncbi:MAG: MBL fold metallo-hydrolase [bacterium]|nr:MBL fold metallo-hydrolase [bacterium]